MCALLGVHAVLRARHAVDSVGLLAGSVFAAHDRDRTSRELPREARSAITVTSNTHATSAPLMLDGRADTAWSTIDPQAVGTSITVELGRPHRVRALRLATDAAATQADVVVDGSLDGETWTRLPVTIARADFFAERPWLELRLKGRARFRSVRITATAARPVAWTISELEVRIAPGAARDQRRRSSSGRDADSPEARIAVFRVRDAARRACDARHFVGAEPPHAKGRCDAALRARGDGLRDAGRRQAVAWSPDSGRRVWVKENPALLELEGGGVSFGELAPTSEKVGPVLDQMLTGIAPKKS
jgi:hypothetical protein